MLRFLIRLFSSKKQREKREYRNNFKEVLKMED